MRCLGHEKVAQLEMRIGTPLRLYSGYSDSKQDNPLLYFASTAGASLRVNFSNSNSFIHSGCV